MNAAGFWLQLGLALLLSVSGALLFHAAAPWLGGAFSLRAVLLGVALAYLAAAWAAHGRRSGRLIALSFAAIVVLALFWLQPPLWLWASGLMALIWLQRSLLRYTRLWPVALDAGLCLLSLAVAALALRYSHSLALALWCAGLLQALHVYIPARLDRRAMPDGRFQRAQAAAEAALAQLDRGR